MGIEELFAEIKQSLENINNAIELKSQELERLTSKASQAEEDLSKIQRELKAAQQQEIEQRGLIERTVIEVKQTKNKLEEENKVLTIKKGELMKENIRLERRNESLKIYEKTAWQALNNKDQELRQRDEKIREKEQFKPEISTFLPPAA